jgi:hypothetical protein
MPNYTLTYSPSAEGWPSFYSYNPDWMIGMNNYFYTFKGGNLYRHNVNATRNRFYGVNYPSTIQSVFNESPLINKLFKTINIEGDDTWDVDLYTDIQTDGFILANYFEKKEQAYFAFIRNSGTVPASQAEYPLRSVNGIGRSATIVSTVPSAVLVNYSISPLISIGSIISIGDYLYYSLPPTYSTPILFGEVTGINVDLRNGVNQLVVDTTIIGGGIPLIQDPYTMYIKNSIAESHGLLGHYCVFTLTNDNTNKIELFTLESEVMKSYP